MGKDESMLKRSFFRKLRRGRGGLTLTELILSTVLLAMIVMTVAGISISARKILYWSRNRAMALSKAGIAMDHVVRNLRLANGLEITGSAGNWVIKAWIDRAKTPSDFSDDREIRYTLNAQGVRNALRYVESGVGAYDIVWGITKFEPRFDNTDDPFYMTIELAVKGDSDSPLDPNKNPEVNITAGVNARSMDMISSQAIR